VTPAGAAEKGIGRRWATADGRAGLSIYSLRNRERYTPAGYLERYLKDRPSEIQYKRVANDFFAVSKYSGRKILYRRCNFSLQTIHCIDLSYPSDEKSQWDAVVTRISRSLRPLHS
jgi:hypothetical protein